MWIRIDSRPMHTYMVLIISSNDHWADFSESKYSSISYMFLADLVTALKVAAAIVRHYIISRVALKI